MAAPEVIPTGYEPDYHTGTIGHWEGGQFLGSVVAAFPESYTITDDWPAHKRRQAVLHTFDTAGHHLDSRIECTGTDDHHRAAVDAAQEWLKQWLDTLPGLRYGNIAIRPFRHEVVVDWLHPHLGSTRYHKRDETGAGSGNSRNRVNAARCWGDGRSGRIPWRRGG